MKLIQIVTIQLNNKEGEKLKRIEDSNGITLIALIVTIIVLLILSGVSVATLTGDNALIKMSQQVKKSAEQAELEEEVNLKVLKREGNNEDDLEKYLKEIQNANLEQIGQNTWYVTRNKAEVTVYDDGEIIEGKVKIWDGQSQESPEFKESNWYISTPGQLKFLADFVNNGNTLTTEQEEMITAKGYNSSDITMTKDTMIYLMGDLDLGARATKGMWETAANEALEWMPIGKESSNKRLLGTFEGNEHIIKGVYINTDTNFNGIFGNSNSIKNLTIKNSYIKGGTATAGIVGALRSGTVENCHNINTTCILIEGSYYTLAGVVGQSQGTVTNCTNSGTIIGYGIHSSQGTLCGGVLGGNLGTITNCVNTGTVTGYGNRVGGIVGLTNNSTTITNCSNVGEVIGKKQHTGGIVGIMVQSDEITNSKVEKCYNSGSIKGENYAGGIVGLVSGSKGQGTVISCYSKGKVEGKTNIGAIIGAQTNTTGLNTLNNLYYLNTVGIGAIKGKDDENNNIMSTTKDINSYDEFITWIENK